jgi:colanic acid/amylovoran biosynthesis glycosyltransferase
MKVAYLTNQYPKPSHSFIRREINGLEAGGASIERISVRPAGDDVVDRFDLEEIERTHVLLDGGVAGLLVALVRGALLQPIAFAAAFGQAMRLGRKSDRGRLYHLAYLAEAVKLARLTRRLGIDHLHVHFGTNPTCVALLARILGGPDFSFTVHGPEEFDRPEAVKLREKIAASRFTVAISEFGRSQLYRWSAFEDWKKIAIVHCGVDEIFLRSELTPVPETPRLVCVGRLCEQKGHFVLVEAAARLAERGVDFELVLAGDGEMRAEVENLARRRGVLDRTRITGWIGNEQVRDEILAARAMVLPSFAEGLPVVIMEALALGRPVISTFVAGIPELVESGECGWLVPSGDIEALVEAMHAALIAPVERLGEMGREGHARVRERHDATREAAKLAKLFEEGA